MSNVLFVFWLRNWKKGRSNGTLLGVQSSKYSFQHSHKFTCNCGWFLSYKMRELHSILYWLRDLLMLKSHVQRRKFPTRNFQHCGRRKEKEQICIWKEADSLVPLESHISNWNEQMSVCSLLLMCEAVDWAMVTMLKFSSGSVAPTKNKLPVLGLSHFHTWICEGKEVTKVIEALWIISVLIRHHTSFLTRPSFSVLFQISYIP